MIIDCIVIGSGFAGCSASVYLSMGGKKHLLIGGDSGGVIKTTKIVDNFLGFHNIPGFELAEKIVEHATSFSSCTLNNGFVTKINRNEKGVFEVVTESNGLINTFYSITVILATGSKPKKLPLEDVDGVCYCAVCDGFHYREKNIAIVGGGNSAFEAAIYLGNLSLQSSSSKKIHFIHRSKKFKAFNSNVEQLKKLENVVWHLDTEIVNYKVKDGELIGLVLNENGKNVEIECEGLFVCIGHEPNTNMLNINGLEFSNGYLVCNNNMKTSIEGLFAAGDVVHESNKQACVASGQGCTAAMSCIDFLNALSSK